MPAHSATPFYRRILIDAWHIAWRHKHLWVFGLFAATVGFGGVSETLFSSDEHVYSLMPGMQTGSNPIAAVPGMDTLRFMAMSGATPGITKMVLAIALLGCIAAFCWMVYASIAALISSIRKIERGGDATFEQGMRTGSDRFWSVIGVNFAMHLFVLACFVLIAASFRQFIESGSLWRGAFFIGTFALFAGLTVIASAVAILATCEAVIHKYDARTSLAVAGEMIRAHWLSVLETGIALFVSCMLIGLAAVAAAGIIALPFRFLILAGGALNSPLLSFATLMAGSALMIIVIVTVGSFITTYQAAAWTLLWSSLSRGESSPKLLRLAKRHFPSLA